MYEPRTYDNVLQFTTEGKMYIEIGIDIDRYIGQKIKVYKTEIVPAVVGTKDFLIVVKVTGAEGGEVVTESLGDFTFEIMNSTASDVAGVKTDIGIKTYHWDCNVQLNGSLIPVKTASGTISQNSDIEIV